MNTSLIASTFVFLWLVLNMNDANAKKDCDLLLTKRLYLAHMMCFGEKRDPISIHERSISYSFAGDDVQSEKLFESEEIAQHLGDQLFIPDSSIRFRRYDALPQLGNLSRGRSVVMLNEAYHVSRHRIFALQLARVLRKQGFTHLAVEGLSTSVKTNELGYVSLDNPATGAYTQDPEFAYFLREAINLGYELVSYEVFNTKSIEERELGQAKNIAKIIENNPYAKVFIYAGYGHIRKSANKSHIDWMAKIFSQLTGINPLSIDQVGGTPSYYSALTPSTWKEVENDLISTSSVFKENGNWLVSGTYKGAVDITVFHPKQKLNNGRPDWLSENRQKHVVKASSLGTVRPAIVRAILKGDKNGVPIDQVYLRNVEDVTLLIPSGEYDIELENLENGNRIIYTINLKPL
jgi:hypothetical protein